MPKLTLDDILADADALLDVKPPVSPASSEQQRILDSFEEVNRFVDRHKRLPADTETPSVSERSLRLKFNGMLNDTSIRGGLLPHDRPWTAGPTANYSQGLGRHTRRRRSAGNARRRHFRPRTCPATGR